MFDDETLGSLLGPAAEGDAAAFTRIVELCHDDMARVAFVVSGDVELAGDAVKAAWPSAWRGLGTMRNPERLRAWLMSLGAREARWLTEAGDRAREDAGRGDAGVPATRAASAPAYRRDELDLANAFASLDSHDRMIVGLRYVAGLSPDDIGRELGMPAGAVQARLARILKRLLVEPGRLAASTDTIEAYERALAERIRSFSSRAVVPFDAAVVAQAAVEAVPPPGLADQLGELWEELRSTNRLGWIVAAGLVVIVAGAALALGGPGPAPIPTPVPTDATRLCEPDELEARVTAWEPAGDERIAAVEMRNVGGVACLVDNLPAPWLVERPVTPLLIGFDAEGSLIRIGPGDVLRTRVTVRNYCGIEPRPPVTVAFRRGTDVMLATALTPTDLSGVPPCGGYPGSPADIVMQAWAP